MSSPLALSLCTGFVLFLLWIERKQAPAASLASWIPTIWMLIIATKPLSKWFGVPGDPIEGSLVDRVVLVGLLCLGLVVLAKRRINWAGVMKANSYLVVLVSYMLVSIAWSSIPFVSFKRWTRELVAIVMAILVLSEREPRESLLSVFRRSIYILIPFSLLLIKYYPHLGIEFHRWTGERTWIGVTMQKNGLGRLCIFSAFFLIWTFVRRRRGEDVSPGKYHILAGVPILVLALWLLRGPPGHYPATAVVTLVVGLAFLFGLLLLRKRHIVLRPNALAMIMALIIGFGIVTVMVGGANVAKATSALGRDTTLTGRTEVWALLVPVFERDPILGKGFGGFWTSKTREFYEISDAHSGYLDVLLELGFVGILLNALFLLGFCRKAQRELSNDFAWASLCICCLAMALVHNISETSLSDLTSHLTAILLFLAVTSTAVNSKSLMA